MEEEKHCPFVSRVCGDKCVAFNSKKRTCKVISSLESSSSSFRTILKWLAQHDPPRP